MTLEPLAIIGRLSDPVLFQRFPKVIRDGRGRYFAAVLNVDGHEIALFDGAGSFVRKIGGYGEGPGEFRIVTDIALGADDTLYVVHDRYRVSVFDTTGHFVRMVLSELGAPIDALMPTDDGFVANAAVRTDSRAGFPLHVLDREGKYRRSIGDSTIPAPVRTTGRIFNTAMNRTLWVAQSYQYKFDNIDTHGRRFRVIGVAAPKSWYTVTYMTHEDAREAVARSEVQTEKTSAVVQALRATPAKALWPPPFAVSGVYASVDGLLFVSVRVAAAEWQEVEVTYDHDRWEVPRQTEATQQKQYRTIIDAIDVASGEVRARTEIDGYAYLTNDGTLVRVQETDQGLIQAEAYAVRFTR